MAELDLVQLRWHQLRSFESSQVTRQENFELKSQVLQLRAQRVESDLKNKRALAQLWRTVSAWIGRTRGDLSSLKSTCLSDLSKAMLVKDSLQEGLAQMKLQGHSHDTAMEFLQRERKRLLEELDTAQEEIKVANKSKLAEIDRHHAQMERVRTDLAEADTHRATLLSRIDEYEVAKGVSQQRYDALHRQCEGLVVTIQKLEAENAQTLIYAREAEQRLLADHDHQLHGLLGENAKLHLRIVEQEEQIDRLTAALMGNKSHFQKFVELKQENVVLHSELKNIHSKQLSTQLLVLPQAQGGGQGSVGGGRDGTRRARGQVGRGGQNLARQVQVRNNNRNPGPGPDGDVDVDGVQAGGSVHSADMNSLGGTSALSGVGTGTGGGSVSGHTWGSLGGRSAAPRGGNGQEGPGSYKSGRGREPDPATQSLLAGKSMRISRGSAESERRRIVPGSNSHSPVRGGRDDRDGDDAASVQSEMTWQSSSALKVSLPRSVVGEGDEGSPPHGHRRGDLRPQPQPQPQPTSDEFYSASLGFGASLDDEFTPREPGSGAGTGRPQSSQQSQPQPQSQVQLQGKLSSMKIQGEPVVAAASPRLGSSQSQGRSSRVASPSPPGPPVADAAGSVSVSSLPLSVPLLSKETRDGLANRSRGLPLSLT